MAVFKLLYNATLKVVTLRGSADSIPSGSVSFGTFSHGEANDANDGLGLAANHSLFAHIEQILNANNIIDLSNVRVLNYQGGTVPVPVFITNPSITTENLHDFGYRYLAHAGAASDTTKFGFEWLIGATVVSTKNVYHPDQAGNLALRVTATGPGGSVQYTTTPVIPVVANPKTVPVAGVPSSWPNIVAPPAPTIPAPILAGIPLRGNVITASGLNGATGGGWYARTNSSGSYTLQSGVPNPMTIGNGTSPAGGVGKQYIYRATLNGTNYDSSPIGPIGITDGNTSSSAFHSINQDIANLNTKAIKPSLIAGTDYNNSLSYFSDDFGANIDFKYNWTASLGTIGTAGTVSGYGAICRNNYFGGVPVTTPAAAIQMGSLAIADFNFNWNLTRVSGDKDDINHLIEFYSINVPTFSNGAITNEIALLPSTSASARSFFLTGSGRIALGTYVDENALSWGVSSMPGVSNGRYIAGYEPAGTPRLSGTICIPRYLNWLIAQGAISSADYMPGLASGFEMINRGPMAGEITGKLFPAPSEMPWNTGSALTLDSDVTAFIARLTNKPGYDIIKALNTFILGLKTASIYTLIDDMNFFWLNGKTDMRRAFKSSTHDLVDATGTAVYVPGKGVSYAGAGYGTLGFNPATAAGQTAQDSTLIGFVVEDDVGAVAASYFGNAGCNMARNTAGNSISHRINDAAAQFGGVLGFGELITGRRVAGIGPEGTAGSAGYQVKHSANASALFDATATSTALTSSTYELGRAGSGTVYSSATFSMAIYGGGMTATQVNTLNTLYNTLRTSVKAAGI